MVALLDPSDDQDDILRMKRSREKQYVFDVGLGPNSSQVSKVFPNEYIIIYLRSYVLFRVRGFQRWIIKTK